MARSSTRSWVQVATRPGCFDFQKAWSRSGDRRRGCDANIILTEYLGRAPPLSGSVRLSHQPAGEYEVFANAIDHNNNWAESLRNTFDYLPVTAFEIDFDTVNYGNVNINSPKKIAGNTIFSMGDGRPTVRNIGNTDLQVVINQDNMGLDKSVNGWNVEWGARMGHEIGYKYYKPFETVTLPNALPRCEADELDFSIEVFKGKTGEKTGIMTLGAIQSPKDV